MKKKCDLYKKILLIYALHINRFRFLHRLNLSTYVTKKKKIEKKGNATIWKS